MASHGIMPLYWDSLTGANRLDIPSQTLPMKNKQSNNNMDMENGFVGRVIRCDLKRMPLIMEILDNIVESIKLSLANKKHNTAT